MMSKEHTAVPLPVPSRRGRVGRRIERVGGWIQGARVRGKRARRGARIPRAGVASRALYSVITLAAVALIVAACGSSSDPGVAHLSSGKDAGSASSEGGGSSPEGGASAQQKMVAFANCMRSHGVANFPEPVEGKLILRGGPGQGINPGSAQFEAAQKACHNLMPEGGKLSPQKQKQAEERALKFSACMRSHGEPNFPEPEFHGGGVALRLKAGPGGLDPKSPQFQAAQKACRQYLGPPGSKGELAPPPGGEGSTKGGGAGGGEQNGSVAAP
jgi:hypothetical protein